MPNTNTLSFKEAISSILSSSSVIYQIELQLKFASGEIAVLDPEQIRQHTINQDYHNKYRDVLYLVVGLTKLQAITLLNSRQDLKAMLTVKLKINGKYQTLYSNSYMVNVLESNSLDIVVSKKTYVSDDDKAGKEIDIEMHLELVEEPVYHLRKQQFAFILHNATMKEALLTVAQACRFKDVFIEEPDNKTRYANLIVPPLMGIEDVFGYLQHSEGYDGVYLAGINHYIQDGILYVFPLQHPVTSTRSLNIYNAGPMLAEGASRYHSVTTATLNIVIADKIEAHDDTHVKVERNGTWANVYQPKKVLNDVTLNGGVVEAVPNLITTVAIDPSKLGITKTTFTQAYHISNNVAKITEELYANGISVIKVNWRNACPYLIAPDMVVTFISETPSGIKHTPCLVGQVSYNFIPASSGERMTYRCDAQLTLLVNRLIQNI